MAPDPSERALQSNRKECHKTRDLYFQCMMDNNGEESKCRFELKAFKDKCPESWVAHFIRKHKFEQFKQVRIYCNRLYSLSLERRHEQFTRVGQGSCRDVSRII